MTKKRHKQEQYQQNVSILPTLLHYIFLVVVHERLCLEGTYTELNIEQSEVQKIIVLKKSVLVQKYSL
jgi:hypothetical protein